VQAVWVSFDVIGRRSIEAAVESGAHVTGIVTLLGEASSDRSGQCRFDDLAEALGARLIPSGDVNDTATIGAVAELAPDAIFVGWSQLVREEFISLARRGGVEPHVRKVERDVVLDA
jgi:hypothetical protein